MIGPRRAFNSKCLHDLFPEWFSKTASFYMICFPDAWVELATLYMICAQCFLKRMFTWSVPWVVSQNRAFFTWSVPLVFFATWKRFTWFVPGSFFQNKLLLDLFPERSSRIATFYMICPLFVFEKLATFYMICSRCVSLRRVSAWSVPWVVFPNSNFLHDLPSVLFGN